MTLKFGLLGEKLGHSLSPQIHTELYRLLGLDARYDLLEIPKGQLPARFAQLRQEYAGLNVTIPYKLDVMRELDTQDPAMQAIGACNTVCFAQDGQARGYNTDYFGFERLLRRYSITVAGKVAVVLGTGGAARAVLHCLADLGARSVVLVTRSVSGVPADLRAAYADVTELLQREVDAPAAKAGTVGPRRTVEAALMPPRALCTYAELPAVAGDVLVNCTPVGMWPKVGVSPVDDVVLAGYQAAVDVVYNPAQTEFLRRAASAGLQTANGLFMLVAQAIASEELWLKRTLGDDVIETIAAKLAAEQAVQA